MEQILTFKYIGAACVYSLLGLVILAVACVVFDKLTPGNLWKEILVEHNISVAITVGAMMLAIAQIIASAIHG